MLRELLIQIPIEEVFQHYVGGELKRRGNKLLARCPFHGGNNGDKNPSLTIYKETNSWYCFGCTKGGSPIDLVMQSCGLRFKDAARLMSKDFGIVSAGASSKGKEETMLLVAKLQRDLGNQTRQTENEAYILLAGIYRKIQRKLAGIKTISDMEKYGELYHQASFLEYILEKLALTQRRRA